MMKLKKFLKSERVHKILLLTSFACFLFLLCWIVIFKMGNNKDINKMFNGKQGTFSLKKRFDVGKLLLRKLADLGYLINVVE